MRSAWLGLAMAVACSGGGNDRAPAMPAEGGSSTGGKKANPATGGSSASGDAGAAGDDSAQGGTGEGGAGEGGTGLVLPVGGAPEQAAPGVCAPELQLGGGQAQDVGVDGVTLLSMTSDELSVAFTTGAGAQLALHVADRDASTAAFEAVSVTVPDGFEAASGVSLSSDGLKLILVMTDHSGFGELSRAARGSAFSGDADLTAFTRINGLKPMSGHSVGWPVLSHDGNDLYFVSYFGGAIVNQSHRGADDLFDIGTEIDEFTLGGPEGEYKLLSGLSADQRAIFYFDEKSQHAMAQFRSSDGAPFTDLLDLGVRRGMAPNAACNRLYSSVGGKLVAQARK